VALRATRDSPRLVPFLAVRQILRRANSTRLALLVAVALSLATLAVTTWSVGRSNRDIRAGNEVGADRVVTVRVPAGANLQAAVDAADPSGHDALAAELLPVSSTQLLAIDTTRLATIARWRPDFSSSSLSSIARLLHPRLPVPLQIGGRTASMTMNVDRLTPHVPLQFGMTVSGADHVPAPVEFGLIVPGRHSYTAQLPEQCRTGCRLVSLTFTTRGAYSAPVDSRDPGFQPELDADITGIDSDGADAAHRATLAAALHDTYRWRQGGTNGNLIVVERNGLYVRVAPPAATTEWPVLLSGDVPEHVPGLVASSTAAEYPGAQRHDISAIGLDANPLPVDGLRTAVVLPRLGQQGVVADLTIAERAMTGPEAVGVQHQVWLSPTAASDVLDRLHRAGIVVVATDTVAAHRAVLERTGPAYADTVFLLAALAATILAIGGAVLAALVTARRRSYELAALEAVGVRPRTLRWASALEQGLLIGRGVLFGVASGIAGSAMALPSTPIFVDPNSGPPLEYGLPWRTLLVLITALVVLLALLCVFMARIIERQADASRLREAGL
jgi:hypothetical protein